MEEFTVATNFLTWIGLGVAYYFYRKSGDQLLRVGSKLQQSLNVIATVLESQGWADVARDKHNDVIGLNVTLEVHSAHHALTTHPADIELKVSDPPPKNRDGI